MIKDPTLIKLNPLDFDSHYTLDLKKERIYGQQFYSKPLSNCDRDIKKSARSVGSNKRLGGVLSEK
jgi:hypothetical protein